MSKDIFEGWDAGPDPDHAERSRQIIEAYSDVVPWSGTEAEFTAGVQALFTKLQAHARDKVAMAQVVGAFRWWSEQPGNTAWRARVKQVAERLSLEFLER